MTLAFQEGTQIRFANSITPVDDGTNLTRGTPTDCTFSMASVADDAGRQSNKVDLGANRHSQYEVLASMEIGATTPVSGATIDFYWAPSTSSTTANGNVMGNSGLDAAAASGAVPSGITLDEFLAACDYIGSLTITDDATTVQTGFVGVFSPSSRYGQLVAANRTGATMVANNDEHHVVFNPIVVTDV